MSVALGAARDSLALASGPENGTRPMTIDLSDEAAAGRRYAYKASLIGSAHQFELTEQGLSWRVGRKARGVPHSQMSRINLSDPPAYIHTRRFCARIQQTN